MGKAMRQAVVMIVELDDGALSIVDAAGDRHEAVDGGALWYHAKSILKNGDAPALESGPAAGKSAKSRAQNKKVEEAMETIGQRFKEAAEAEYGAPLVGAVSTVVGHTTQKATGFLRKLSRRSNRPSRRFSKRRTG